MLKSILIAAVLVFCATGVDAEPTHVMVRAQALDAKFIGDHMGGVRITLIDARTGAVLATGLTTGGTGDTARIMRNPRARGVEITDHDTAGFEAVLNVTEPTLVTAQAVGPVGKPGAAVKVSSSLWIIPGGDVLGDGWILTMPGLVIEPTTSETPGGDLLVNAKVSLMCGCPIEPGGIWDSGNYTVEALVLRGGLVFARTPLAYAGAPSQYTGRFPALPPGAYTLRVVARDSKSPNAGVAEAVVAAHGAVSLNAEH